MTLRPWLYSEEFQRGYVYVILSGCALTFAIFAAVLFMAVGL
jgi:hypothetical protein